MATIPGTGIPWVKSQFFTDTGGTPAAGYYLYTYVAGTSSQAKTYSDKDLTTANANPIVLDANGRAVIFLRREVAYKFVLVDPKDSADPQSSNLWTRDLIQAPPFYGLDSVITRDEIAQEGWSVSDTTQTFQCPYRQAILYNRYVGGSTTGDISIPAGTFQPISANVGDCLILEWEATYASAIVAARSTIAGTTIDATTGAASTDLRAKYVIFRADNVTLDVSWRVIQDTGAGAAQVEMGHQQIAGLNLTTTDYTVDMTTNSPSTATVYGARALFGKSIVDWTAL